MASQYSLMGKYQANDSDCLKESTGTVAGLRETITEIHSLLQKHVCPHVSTSMCTGTHAHTYLNTHKYVHTYAYIHKVKAIAFKSYSG